MSSTDSTDAFPGNQRVLYREGILLDSSDFNQEQQYHRSSLAAALRHTLGFGTIAGLRVERSAGAPGDPLDDTRNPPEQLFVHPGIALDRTGRLIEVKTKQSLRLNRWFNHQVSLPGANLKPYRAPDDTRYFVADVFLRHNECPQGLRPSFPEPAADSTDALTASRSNDSFELLLVARDCDPETTLPKTPANRFPTPPANKAALLDQIYNAYGQTSPAIDQEYPKDFDYPEAVFLTRVRIRLKDAPNTSLDRIAAADVVIDDLDRPVAPPSDLLRHLLPA